VTVIEDGRVVCILPRVTGRSYRLNSLRCQIHKHKIFSLFLLPLGRPYSMLDQMSRYDALENEVFNYSAGGI
jgi:hypothetical protein